MKILAALAALLLGVAAGPLPSGNYEIMTVSDGSISSKISGATIKSSADKLEVNSDCANLSYKVNSQDGDKFSLEAQSPKVPDSCSKGSRIQNCLNQVHSWDTVSNIYRIKCKSGYIGVKKVSRRRHHHLSDE